MQSRPPHVAPSDGHYNYRNFGCQVQQYQALHHHHPLQQQQQQQQDQQAPAAYLQQPHVGQSRGNLATTQQYQSSSQIFSQAHTELIPGGFREVKTEPSQEKEQLALIPHIAAQAPGERTVHNSPATRKYPHREYRQQRQQRQQARQHQRRYHLEYRRQPQQQRPQLRPQQQQQPHNHNHRHRSTQLPDAAPKQARQAGRPKRRAPRISGEKEASLRCWLSEYMDAGEVQGNDMANLDEAEHNPNMDEPLPPTSTSPKSMMTLSPAQISNGPVSAVHHHNKDSKQTLQGVKAKRDAHHSGSALGDIAPFNAQGAARALGQVQVQVQVQPPYYQQTGTGQDYSNGLLQSGSVSHMQSMPAIQEGQALQFNPLGAGYHHQNMQLVDNAFLQQQHHQQHQQQTAAALSGFPMTDKSHSIPMATSLSLSSALPGPGVTQNARAAPACIAGGPNGAPMVRSRSNIEATANTIFSGATAATNGAACQATAHSMARTTSARTFTASEQSSQVQPLVNNSAGSGNGVVAGAVLHQAPPMQHSLSSESSESASSGSSFLSQSALHPLFAPSVLPTAFYSSARYAPGTVYPFLGQVQPQHPPGGDSSEHVNNQWAGVKRPASSLDHHMTPQSSAKRRMQEAEIKEEEEIETSYISSDDREPSFNFDDYIDMTQSHTAAEATTSGPFAEPLDACFDSTADQAISSELMRSIEGLSSDAARTTALVTATTPPLPVIEHNGTVSPEDLYILPFSDTRPIVKQESDTGASSCMAVVPDPEEPANYFPEFDPILAGSHGDRSSADVSNAAVDLGARGMDEVYSYGSVIGSPKMPQPSPISDLSTYSSHIQHCNCNRHNHAHAAMVHQPTVGREMQTYGNPSQYPPPDSHFPHGPHGPHGPRDSRDHRDSRDSRDSRDARNPRVAQPIPDASFVPRPAMDHINIDAETQMIRMRAAEEQRHADFERRRKDRILLQLKREGYTYREIREKGHFTEAESTLRGRYRTLTKAKQERVRKPTWTEKDDRLLVEAVNFMARGRPMGQFKVAWKAVSERIVDNGGSYRFGNTTCRKRYDYLVEEDMVSLRCLSQATDNEDVDDDDEDDEEEDDDDDDEPSIVYFNEGYYAGME